MTAAASLSRNIAPAPETLEEVKLQTSLYDAATGRNGGGNFQVVSKSGTNTISRHGLPLLQNDKLIANDFFFNRAGIDKPMLRRNEGGFTVGGPIRQEQTFFFGSYQLTRAQTSFVDEASNTVLLPRALTDDRSDAGIDSFAAAIWTAMHGPVNLAAINPISRSLLQGEVSRRHVTWCRRAPTGLTARRAATRSRELQGVSVIPATFDQDQFSINIDQQMTTANRLSGKFFFTNQPSSDPLASGSALTLHEREETTYQRTFSLTDVHVFSSGDGQRVPRRLLPQPQQQRSGRVLHQRANSGSRTRLRLRCRTSRRSRSTASDVGGELAVRHAGRRHAHLRRQKTLTYGDTLSSTRGKHSLRVGGEFRRNQLDGELQETRNGRHNFDSWFDFLTVGYRNPATATARGRFRDTASTTARPSAVIG